MQKTHNAEQYGRVLNTAELSPYEYGRLINTEDSSIRQGHRNMESVHELQEIQIAKNIPLGSALMNERNNKVVGGWVFCNNACAVLLRLTFAFY